MAMENNQIDIRRSEEVYIYSNYLYILINYIYYDLYYQNIEETTKYRQDTSALAFTIAVKHCYPLT